MGKTFKRGERRNASNQAAKRRICEMRDVCGGMEWNPSYDSPKPEPKWDKRYLGKAKHQHPFGGETRRMHFDGRPTWPKIKEKRRDFSDGDDYAE